MNIDKPYFHAKNGPVYSITFPKLKWGKKLTKIEKNGQICKFWPNWSKSSVFQRGFVS